MLDQTRVIIENISPRINCGKHFIKRVVGEIVSVTADVFSDGHDIVAAQLLYKHENERSWKKIRLRETVNDSWTGTFPAEKQGFYSYKILAWVDNPLTWQHGIERKLADGQYVYSELLEGAQYLKEIAKQVDAKGKKDIAQLIKWFEDKKSYDKAISVVSSRGLNELFEKYPIALLYNESEELKVYVDRPKARFSTWYELFPRSASPSPSRKGTLKDVIPLLPRIAKMGFDVLYLPPINPIGEVNRKGKNNATTAKKGDVGSPWGIGSQFGGHDAIHPDLGTVAHLKELVKEAQKQQIEIALDFALQAAPDHPWVKTHPEWFKWRPDGTAQYAENPPKKYQDILPIYFESPDWKNLWEEMLRVALFWVEECGIRIFRVDNPHTKPYRFWGWLISQIKKKYPDVLFLSEAFTRPKVMQQLTKQGFSQTYSYFTWRTTKQELIEYMLEITKSEMKEYHRPNFWPNTPDINPYHLQDGNQNTFLQRYFLAATLSSNTGIYGPVFEYMVCTPVPGKEEYLNSEKYEVYHWDWNYQNQLTTVISRVNHIRKLHTALQQTNNIRFLTIENDKLLAFHKWDDTGKNQLLIVINLDSHHTQTGWVQVPLAALGIAEGHRIRMHDLMTGNNFIWEKEWCYVSLNPDWPFHLFEINL